jgi:hypothetical protein
MLAIACLAASSAARAEDPLRFLQELMRPPTQAAERTLQRFSRAAAPALSGSEAAAPVAKPRQSAETDLLSVPMPHLRPGDAGGDALGYAPATTIEAAPLAPKDEGSPMVSAPVQSEPPASHSACSAALAALGVEARPSAPVQEGACRIPAPVSVAAFDGGAVALSTKALLDCDFADAVATWMKDTVQPIALKTLGHKVTGLRIAASYACRNRDGLADAKLSEHARGDAIDISGFDVADVGWIEVETGWKAGGAKSAFLQEVRASACGPFTTVLGPGADSFHSSHFHLDRAKRRTAGPSKGLFCQ